MEENKLISYEMFFKKTLIVETLFHEEKKMIPIKSSSKKSRILLFPLYSFQPSQSIHTHRPHITLPPTQFTLTKTETSMYLTFILQFLTCTIQCLTSTFSLYLTFKMNTHTQTSLHLTFVYVYLDPPNEHSPVQIFHLTQPLSLL